MAPISPGHARKFGIADQEAVRVLLDKLAAPRGSNAVDQQHLVRALNVAAQEYGRADEKVRQAFLHGLLTGYGVALKHK